MNKDSAVSLEQPTRVRYGVLGFACSLSMITYLDRVCFGTAMPSLQEALGLGSEADLKWAVTAFSISYAAFEIPSGWLGDVYGPKNVLIRIVLWWSVFTALTGLTGLTVAGLTVDLVLLALIRFLFGVGEAGTYPNITRALHNWFPFTERGLAQGTVWMSGRLMGGLTPLIWMVLVGDFQLSWRAAFGIFGCIGICWCVLFALWFRNRPEQKETVNLGELDLIRAGRTDVEAGHARVPWLTLLTSGNLWLICFMYFFASYGWYFNITYLPSFLKNQFHVDPKTAVGAIYMGGPLWLGAFACIGGGFLTDWFIRRTGNRKWGRRLFGVVGHGLCSLCLFACLFAPSAFVFFLFISLGAFFNDLTMGSAWAACQDIGKRYAAIVAGCMNTIGNLGGAVAGWATGTVLELAQAHVQSGQADTLTRDQVLQAQHTGYQINLTLFALAYVIAVVMWLWFDSTRPVVADVD